MTNGILKLVKENWLSALVYGVLFGLMAMAEFIVQAKGISGISWMSLSDAGIVAALAAMVSLVKNLLTTETGKFLGFIKVIPENK